MDCCENIDDLGCLQSCDLVQIGVLATQTGLYTIEIQPNGTQIFQTTNTAGTPLVFSNGFNEDGISVFKILQPDGTYLEVDGKDCFQIKNSVAKNPLLANVTVTPVTCDDATVTVNGAAFGTVASGGSLDIPVVNTENTPLGSKIGADWLIPDTTYEVYIGGNLTQSFTIPTLKNETVNIYP